MAFLKFASAQVVLPNIDIDDWKRLKPRVKKASTKVLDQFDPSQYLLTHCTIMASVNTESPKSVKLGKFKKDGINLDIKYSDYYITPDTSIYVNGNADAWEKQLLGKSCHTFKNAENYLEHYQVPSESKGKIIDVVARDLGDTLYIDILVATNRKHRELVNKILSKKLSTLSMGCTIQFSICSKCGNVAEDETQLCPCIRYEKGSKFTDENGTERVVAELCGHKDVEDSVVFIEASWVADPAFVGAVVHHILNADIISKDKFSKLLKEAFSARRIVINKTQKAASLIKTAQPDEPYDESEFLEDEYGEGEEDEGGEEEVDDDIPDPLDGTMEVGFNPAMEDEHEAPTSYEDLVEELKDKAIADAWDLFQDESSVVSPPMEQFTLDENDTLVESSKKISNNIKTGFQTYKKFGWQKIRGKFSGLELLFIAKKAGIEFTKDEMKTILATGPISKYNGDISKFVKQCQLCFNKVMSNRELKRLVLGGCLLDLKR